MQPLQIKGLNIADDLEKLIPKFEDDDHMSQLREIESTDKWHPLTFAIINGNLSLAKYLISTSLANTKKLLKVPGLYASQVVNRLFPLVMALHLKDEAVFTYFWDEVPAGWNEDSFEALLKLMARREANEMVPLLFL